MIHEPIGTVVAIVPFNAPVMLFAYKVAPALAAGNAVIAKPPTTNPLAVLMVSSLLWEAGLPGDVLQVITGSGAVIGDHLVSEDRVDAVTLTGSTEVGLNVAQIMAKKLKPCVLELGGNDPFIVMDDADLEIAIKDGAFWRMNSAGQICISPKRFIVHNSIIDTFIEGCVEFTKTIVMGFDTMEEAIEIANPFTEAVAEKAIKIIGGALPRFVANRKDIDAASDMLIGSTLAGITLSHLIRT